MLKTLMHTVAAGALLISASAAVAQDSGNAAGTTGNAPATQTDTNTTAEPAAPAVTPDTSAANEAGTATTGGMSAPGAYLTVQGENQISANQFIGETVYNSANESIGDINDLIIDKQGGVAAAVIGVGGFLGMGEKWVAVPFDSISVSQNNDGDDVKLVTTETAETLRAAPEFKTLEEKNDDATASSGTMTDDATTGSTTADPAAPADPAVTPAAPADPAAPATPAAPAE